MKNLFLSLLTAGILLLLVSCQFDSSSKSSVTPSGLEYLLHVDQPGYTPQPGDIVVYFEQVYRNDTSLWMSTRKKGGRPRELVFMKREEVTQPMEIAWFEALSLMSEGDSLTLFQSLDTLTDLPPGLEQGDELTYHFRVVEIRKASAVKEALQKVMKDTSINRTSSGFPYVFHRDVEGASPELGDLVIYHEEYSVNTARQFNSRSDIGQPRSLILPEADLMNETFLPAYEGLMLMSPGDSLTVYQSLQGIDNLPPRYKPEDVIVYTLTLEDIKLHGVGEKIATFRETGQLPGLQEGAEGLQYLFLEKGTGPTPKEGQKVAVHYAGYLLEDGNPFGNSYQRGIPIEITIGEKGIIEGWQQGLPSLPEGSQALLFIPSKLAYGEAGRPPQIPPNADLVFFIEILKVG